ncbi:MAG TPA: NAD(P)-binding domain-containing protein, partial [Acidimicrobiales bacterium]|nr:NAD(P)-binding domain-containing protein [Acidimicrobiales bacterium]
MTKLLIVGGGRMGEALLGGLLAAGWDDLGVVEKVDVRRSELAARFPSVSVVADVAPADGAVIAVKPGDVPAACAALGGTKRVLSIAAGVTIA